jgi:branched-chain amino acid transport system substrate-binding protein
MKRIRSVALMTLMALGAGMAGAQSPGVSDGVVKIGLITDMSGFLSDLTGEGAAVAVRMAVADYGGKVLGKPIEFVVADNQNKADIAASKTREWLDAQKVDMVIDLGNSATALATIEVAKQKNRVAIATSPGTTRITNENCGATVVHYAYDTFALANGIGKALVKKGLDSWYFVTIDFAGGHSIEKDTSDVVKAQGGRVLGAVRHPINPGDFSSFILQAQGSKAKVVGFASAGGDAINAIKTANQFGLPAGGQTLAGLYIFISDIHGLGLDLAQGMYVTTGFYWDQNDETRKWSRRYFEQTKRMPTMVQAANYSATMHYLKAIAATGTDDGLMVTRQMKSQPINDFFARNGRIREDGRMVHDMYLAQVKQKSESKYPWDYYKILATIPGDEAFQPLARGSCALAKR